MVFAEKSRFDRQIKMKEIGLDGQARLKNTHIAVVGAGGLGSPVLTYLSAAGIGKITIIDMDIVEITNLNRQFLYGEKDLGKPKAVIAKELISEKYSDISAVAIVEKLTDLNIETMLSGVDIIVDCVDNIATRLLVNDYAIRSKTPLVEGGIDSFYGYGMCITNDSACLRCVGYHEGMKKVETPVLGATAGIIGSMQASLAIGIALNGEVKFKNQMFQYDGKDMTVEAVDVAKNMTCVCAK